jgi:hypothetical protein
MNTENHIISSFTNEAGYGFLSNFHPSTIYVDGKSYKTCEHAYQAHKTLDENIRDIIRRAATPAEAKKLGRCIQIRPDWDSVKLELMRDFIKKKFENPFLRPRLLSTSNAELVYNNTWNDTFWGICRGTGSNWLGKIIMDERDAIQLEFAADA